MPKCDAETGRPGNWKGCTKSSTVTIVTALGTVLHYCTRHESRVEDPLRRYHTGGLGRER